MGYVSFKEGNFCYEKRYILIKKKKKKHLLIVLILAGKSKKTH